MIIRVRVIPSEGQKEVVGRIGSVVRVKMDLPQAKQEANGGLISYLAEFFEVPEQSIHIMRGEKAREKTVNIGGRPEDELRRVMESIP